MLQFIVILIKGTVFAVFSFTMATLLLGIVNFIRLVKGNLSKKRNSICAVSWNLCNGDCIMYVRASFVIENSVLIPLFTGIIVTLILFGMRWHDELVVDSIKLQVALKLEQENISDKNEKYNEIIKNAADNARSRLLIKETDMNEITSGINDYIKPNSQSDFIRKTNALLKLKE